MKKWLRINLLYWNRFIIVLLIAVGIITTPACASDSFEVSPKQGAVIVGKHLVKERELWTITWPEAIQDLERRGGMKLRAEMRENWDDYVLSVLYLDDGVWFDFTRDNTLVLRYGEIEVASLECLAAGDAREMTLYYASRNELYFDDTWDPTTKSGGYLLAFRFDKDSLPRGGQWGFERPDEVYIERGTE